MLNSIITYYQHAVPIVKTITWELMKKKTENILYKLTQMKFVMIDDHMNEYFNALKDEINFIFYEYN